MYPTAAAVAKPSNEDFQASLELLCREKIGEIIQAVLEAEVDENSMGRYRARSASSRPFLNSLCRINSPILAGDD